MKTAEELRQEIMEKACEDEAFRARLIAEPHSVVEEIVGGALPKGLTIDVHEETASAFHLVLPPTGRLGDAQLDMVSGGSFGKDFG